MKQIPILFFADKLPPLTGGMEIHADYFIKHFTHHSKMPLIGTISKNADNADIFISEKGNRRIEITDPPNLGNPHVLFFNSGRWIEELDQLKQLFPKATFIYRTGGNEILKAPLAKQRWKDHKARQYYWVNQLNKTLDLIITNSAFTEARLRDMGITPSFAQCIGGVNTQILTSPTPRDHSSPLNIVCAARFVPYKNHQLLITVFHQLLNHGHKLVLQLIGEGPLLPEIKQQVSQLKLNAHIKFLGALDNISTCQKIAAADIYMQLSGDHLTPVVGGQYLHCECMGRSILEAISAGTLVIAGNSGALPEIIHGHRGILLELDNTETMTKAISEYLMALPTTTLAAPTQQYDWRVIFSRYESLISERVYQ